LNKIIKILEGHESHVNTVNCHPKIPLITSGGIDSYVKVWFPNGDYPNDEEIEKKRFYIENICEKNNHDFSNRNIYLDNFYDILRMYSRNNE
jgi:WD40 repeat protein